MRRLGRAFDRGQLRHADARHHAGGADGARPDADLDGVRSGVDQRLGAAFRGDIAGNDLNPVGQLLHAFHGLQDSVGMTVRGVDHHGVHARIHQGLRALIAGIAHR